MKELAVRLKNGADLKLSIQELAVTKQLDGAIVLSAVGSLKRLKIRLANAKTYKVVTDDLEIVSLIGTVVKGEAHLHIAASDDHGNCIGGHLCEGSLVNTTCELVLGILEEYQVRREFDEDTGYKEIEFIRNEEQ